MDKDSIKILKSFTVFLTCILFFSGCYPSKKIKIATSLEGSAAERVGKEIAAYLEGNGWEVEVLSGDAYNGSENISLLKENKVDIAFVPNDLVHNELTKGIQTVMPLYPNLNFILYKNTLTPQNLDELLLNNSILMNEDDKNFYLNLFNYYGINTQELKITEIKPEESIAEIMEDIDSGKYNVVCYFASIHNDQIKYLISNGWELFSLGDIGYSSQGSSVDGFCMNYPRTEPFIIPKNFFGKKPLRPIYTVSLNELIVTRSDADKRLIYDLAEEIYAGKHHISQNEVLFTYVKEEFNRDALNFPLHEGSINFLERNKPTLFERYSGILGVLISFLVVLAGALTSLKQIRKERIDKYYKRVAECRDLAELDLITDEAVRQLQKEKLTADESFTIFLNLIEKKRNDLKKS